MAATNSLSGRNRSTVDSGIDAPTACCTPRTLCCVARGQATLEALGFDVNQAAVSHQRSGALNPVAVTTAIGPRTARAFKPYRFKEPPKAVVNGGVQTGPGRNPAGL